MLVDLLSPANYLMVNRDAIKVLGLNTAVYCSELLTIYKKVVLKKAFVDDKKNFKVDRKYIEKQTSLSIEEQFKCDANLAKVNIIKITDGDPDIIYFDVEIFASVLASEDVKLQEKISAKVKVENPKGTNTRKTEYQIKQLKNSIQCSTPEVLFALYDWVDAICATKWITSGQIKIFKDKLDDYCDGNLPKALEIIKIATVHTYIDCQWAINLYESGNKLPSQTNTVASANATRTTEQKKTTAVSDTIF